MNMPDPLKFIDKKNEAVNKKDTVKNWERKIEIAEVAAKKARGILRQVGEQVEEIVRPEYLMSGGMAGAIPSDEEGENNDDEYEN